MAEPLKATGPTPSDRTAGVHRVVSALVCTYNRAESLGDTLDALQHQALRADLALEIIVVDNNSTDRTREAVEKRVAQPGWPIHYLFERQQGVSYARNTGIAAATGKVLLITDDDVIPNADWAQVLSDAFDTYGADVAGGKILPLWIKQPPGWMTHDALRSHLWNSLAMLDRGSEVIVATPQTCTFPYGANMAFRMSAIKELGGFRTDLGAVGRSLMRGEDTELVARLGDAGKRIVYVPGAVVRHKVTSERMTMGYFRRWKFNSGRSKEHVFPTRNGRFPLWAFRESMEHGAQALLHYVRMDHVRAIEQELLFWSAIGQTVGIMEHRWKR